MHLRSSLGPPRTIEPSPVSRMVTRTAPTEGKTLVLHPVWSSTHERARVRSRASLIRRSSGPKRHLTSCSDDLHLAQVWVRGRVRRLRPLLLPREASERSDRALGQANGEGGCMTVNVADYLGGLCLRRGNTPQESRAYVRHSHRSKPRGQQSGCKLGAIRCN